MQRYCKSSGQQLVAPIYLVELHCEQTNPFQLALHMSAPAGRKTCSLYSAHMHSWGSNTTPFWRYGSSVCAKQWLRKSTFLAFASLHSRSYLPSSSRTVNHIAFVLQLAVEAKIQTLLVCDATVCSFSLYSLVTTSALQLLKIVCSVGKAVWCSGPGVRRLVSGGCSAC